MSGAGAAQRCPSEQPGQSAGAAGPTELELVFRQTRGQILAVLVATMGRRQLARAEALADDLLAHARESRRGGPPLGDPTDWLMAAARQRLVELLERNDEDDPSAPDLSGFSEGSVGRTVAVARRFRGSALCDAELSLLCACCHPALSAPGQAAAILAFSCGLRPAEIAQALQLAPATAKKLLGRARRLLGRSRILDEAPAAHVAERLPPIERALRRLCQASSNCAPAWPLGDHLRTEAERLRRLVTAHGPRLVGPRPTHP